MSRRFYVRFLAPDDDPGLVNREARAVGLVVWSAVQVTIEDGDPPIGKEVRMVDGNLGVATRRNGGTYFWAFFVEEAGDIRTVVHVTSGPRRARRSAFDTAVATALQRRAAYWSRAS